MSIVFEPDDPPFFTSPIPLFSCTHHDGGDDAYSSRQVSTSEATAFCVAEKVLCSFDLVVIGILIYQIAVYIHCHRMKYLRDSRLWIYSMCLVISLYVFFHYAIMNPKARMKMLNVMEFCRFIIMNSLCIFYCKKASKLLKNYKYIVKGLLLWILISIIAYSII